MNNELFQVCNHLKAKGISIPQNNEWLNSCVLCLKSQSANYSVADLKSLVYEQWLLADLRDVGAGTLPPHCVSKEKLVLNGRFAVQFNYGVNISTSFYKQIQKIRRPDSMFNLEVEGESGGVGNSTREKEREYGPRSFKIEITDGVVTVIGFEDKPITSIKELVPGEKAILMGPIEVRNGCLMLRENNVNMLGGEVDTLLVSNAVENVLARALNIPENPNPYKQEQPSLTMQGQNSVIDCVDEDEEALLMVAEAIENEHPQLFNSSLQSTTNVNNQRQTGMPLNNQRMAVSANQLQSQPNNRRQATLTNFLSKPTVVPPQPSTPSVPIAYLDDDFDFPDDDFEMMVQAPKSLNKPNRPLQVTHNTPSCSPKTTNMNDPITLKKLLKSSYENNKPTSTIITAGEEVDFSSLRNSVEINHEAPRPSHEEGKILVDYCTEEPLELDQFKPVTEHKEKQSHKSETHPEWELPFPPKNYPSERRVQGKVVKVSKKLGLKDENWSLSAIISVKGLELEMDFSSEVLDKIFGLTGKELTAKKKEVTTNPAIKEQMNELLRNSQYRIRNLNCIMVIKFANFISNPVVIDVIGN